MRRTTSAGFVLALATAVAFAAAGCTTTAQEPDGAAARSSSAAPTHEVTDEAAATDGPEVGSWSSERVPVAQFEKTMVGNGFGTHADVLLDELAGVRTMSLNLLLKDGFLTLSYAPDDGAGLIADRGTYERDGRRLIVTNSSGTNVLRFRIDDDRLRLRFVSTTEPDYAGAPAAMFQTAWYESTDFARDPA